jgi:hypothetical protein
VHVDGALFDASNGMRSACPVLAKGLVGPSSVVDTPPLAASCPPVYRLLQATESPGPSLTRAPTPQVTLSQKGCCVRQKRERSCARRAVGAGKLSTPDLSTHLRHKKRSNLLKFFGV